ncbi:MAG: zinc ribbon domain-containing protein [Clostridia bacterium]|nr:zinc ribbon domain-containing protein [Clostridia bacterium]
MRYCPNCGKELQDDMQFCPGCGASLQATARSPNFKRGCICIKIRVSLQANPLENAGFSSVFKGVGRFQRVIGHFK